MKTQQVIVNGILENNGKVLIAKRSQNKKIAPGKYHLPGGHVEFGEEPTEALVREFKEEFGLIVCINKVFRTFTYVIDDIHTIGICYLLSSTNNLSNIQVNIEDNEEVIWVQQADLGNYFDSNDHDFITLSIYFKEQIDTKLTQQID
jgi:mutator protein MutT